ncbi:hypothetical protein KHA96_20120 [Bacillus sp. FJAT-49711]|uniref:hypothetical protein n=1 Tax=Bacillus sp. FJAT-49711 TaxID=2833585 RepID=UPI001BC90D1B|nr:hypothetical protein [Bacillus sp. FJAT-49711]MBS4220606.1 hypothetical protein [Bacillus sp. FJAT-49711]
MNYYQARIAIDTAQLLEEMKKIYEKKSGVTITKGNVIMKAYEDSLWVDDWKEIFREQIKLSKHYEIPPNSLKLRVQISEEVEQGIKNLKDLLPSVLSESRKLRNVTIGVCIRLILRAAYIKNVELGDVKSSEIESAINRYKEEAKSTFDEDNYKKVVTLLDKLSSEFLNKF